ncbi:MAG: hypothetical protein N3G76_01805 [Candidatus Micrarchaeota archaeon]|nr:hypothetical protein [Candidatus Micrarchaeota archaeon]
MYLPKPGTVALLVIVLLLSSGTAHAATLGDILSASAVGIAIGFVVAGLGYMIAGFIGTPQAQGWAKNEVFENFFTLFIVANIGVLSLASLIFFAVFPVSQSYPAELSLDLNSLVNSPLMVDQAIRQIDIALEGNKDVQPQASSEGYISTETWGIKQVFMASYIFETFLGEWTYLAQIHFNTLGAGSTLGGNGAGIGAVDSLSLKAPLLPGLSKVTDIIEQMNELIILIIFMLLAHKGLLVFISAVGPQLLLIGIFFRSLPFTRRLGSTLMALFITLQFVYPAFILASFSDNFYGKILKEFSGVYVSTDWMTALPDVDGTQIIFISPKEIVQVSDKTKEINFTFAARAALYNFTVIGPDGRTLCKGTAIATQEISCPISVSSLKPLDLISDASKLDEAVYFYNISVDFYGTGYDSLTQSYITEGYKYKETLSVPIFVIKNCTTVECDQKYMVRNAEFNEVRDAYIAAQKNPEQFAENAAQKTANAMVLAQKFTLHYMSEKGMKKATEKLVKQVAKEGMKKTLTTTLRKGAGAVAGGVGAIVTFALSSALIKSDIATAMFDEIACDAYSGYMAQKYIDPPPNAPSVDTSQLDFWKAAWYRAGQAGDFIAEVGVDVLRSYGSMYDASDYKSCAASTGAFNYLAGKATGYSPREFSVTVLMTRVVLAFIISLFSIIVGVTFFRSISESIGGDSSLMGLGKVI